MYISLPHVTEIMFISLSVLTFLTTCLANPLDDWLMFKTNHNKQYGSITEELFRKSIFHRNIDFIKRHNEKAKEGLYTFTLKVNEFADMDHDEFAAKMFGYRYSKHRKLVLTHTKSAKKVPDNMDWRSRGVVAKVKNQGACGSCWAFSAVASTESALAIKNNGSLVELSEQNLVDCSRKQGNEGCAGGMMDFAFKYMEEYGIDSEVSYPYESRDGKCRFHNDTVVTKVKDYVDIPAGDEDALLDAVVSQGPVSVAVHATFMMQFYHHGIFKDPLCHHTEKSLNHGIAVVGYGTEASSGKKYWIVRNSWGSRWGEHGYIRMSRGVNQCGIATSASYPIV